MTQYYFVLHPKLGELLIETTVFQHHTYMPIGSRENLIFVCQNNCIIFAFVLLSDNGNRVNLFKLEYEDQDGEVYDIDVFQV